MTLDWWPTWPGYEANWWPYQECNVVTLFKLADTVELVHIMLGPSLGDMRMWSKEEIGTRSVVQVVSPLTYMCTYVHHACYSICNIVVWRCMYVAVVCSGKTVYLLSI